MRAWRVAKQTALQARDIYLQTLAINECEMIQPTNFFTTDIMPETKNATDASTQHAMFTTTENDLTSIPTLVPNDQLTYTIAPDTHGEAEYVIVTASDSGRKPIYGGHRHAFAGAFGINSSLNYCQVMKGPQNITLAEILGCCHTLLRTTRLINFDTDPPERTHH
jgi:hypothetical protein